MGAFILMMANCISCNSPICFNPVHVPSVRVKGVREPLCKECFNAWNFIHRISHGLAPVAIHLNAYAGEPEENC